jgi:two-component system, OmpR family, sensor histidine kinase TctE
MLDRSSLAWRIGSRLALALITITALGVGGLVWHTHMIEADHGHHGLVHDVIREFFVDLAWGIPVLIGALIVFGTWIVRRSMDPLRAVAEVAAQISPADLSMRLPAAEIPSEVRPVVEATNGALDRLEQAYLLQQRFIANAAHELRTPVATFRAAVERLPASEGKAALMGDVERLSRLTGQLLDLARAERTGDIRQFDAVPVATDIALELAPLAAAKNVSIASELPSNFVITGVVEHLHAILRNLIENAISHAPPGSEVKIKTDDAAIFVEDQGAGVPEEMREAIFERFTRGTWTKAHGSGLGLSIAQEAARRMNARISVTGNVPTGSRFVLRFG